MIMKRIKWLIAFLVVVGFATMAVSGTLEEIAQRGELRVVCQTQGPPFSFIDKNGKRTGSSIELCELIAKEMGVKVTYLDFDWDGIIPALLAKKGDMLAADMTATLKRAMKIAFTKPFMYTGAVVFVKADSPIKTLNDCKKSGMKAAVLLGSTGEAEAPKVFQKAEIKSYKGGGPLLIDAVLKGHADFGINDNSAVVAGLEGFPPNSIRILPDLVTKEPLAFAVRYDSMDLLEWLNLFFHNMGLEGRLEKNLNYWVNSLDWKKDH
jgi:polar amino acid transport system substrate-binding protein